jgi:hypothetical protein
MSVDNYYAIDSDDMLEYYEPAQCFNGTDMEICPIVMNVMYLDNRDGDRPFTFNLT